MNTAFAGTIHLSLVPGMEAVMLPATKGERSIERDGAAIFTGLRSSDFATRNVSRVGVPTDAVPVAVLQVIEDADYRTMFGDLAQDDAALRRLVMTDDQVMTFCVEHRDKLASHGSMTFFLMEGRTRRIGGRPCRAGDTRPLFVARAFMINDGPLAVFGDVFEDSYLWPRANRHRVVVPHLVVS